MRLFLSAGEASGDAYGAQIVKALRNAGAFTNENLARQLVDEWSADSQSGWAKTASEISAVYGASRLAPSSKDDLVQSLTADLESGLLDPKRLFRESVAGIGGRRLVDAGVGITVDTSAWGAVGIVESLGVAPKVIDGYMTAKSLLRITGPGLFVPIDFGFVNVKLAREAKSKGWKVLYFVPPGSGRRDKQGSDLPEVTDAIVTPFPWSAEILNRMGANAHYFGHPLKEMVAAVAYEGPRETVAVLPGSRKHEVERNMDAIAEAVKELDLSLVFAVAPTLRVADVERAWENLGGQEAVFTEDTYVALKSSRAAIVCSGTATLESALCKCPCVVIYRGSKLMEFEYRVRKPKVEFVSLPNILLGRSVVPELIQWDANPDRIRHELEKVLADGPDRQAQLDAFEELDASLGPSDCFRRTADLAMGLCGT